MDLGRSINEAIDYGQISGAYIQGLGWVTTEDLFYNEKGRLLSHSPTTYKIPNIQDTPRVFNIDLIENPHNKQNVRGSKAVGEPPFLLGLSAWTAIKEALLKARFPNRDQLPLLNLPATPHEIVRFLYENQKEPSS